MERNCESLKITVVGEGWGGAEVHDASGVAGEWEGGLLDEIDGGAMSRGRQAQGLDKVAAAKGNT